MRRPVSAQHRPRRLHGGLAGLIATACLVWSGVALGDGLSTSAQYIVGFVRYVHWQAEDDLDAWHVCILGAVPVEQDRLYASEIVRGKHFVARRIGNADELSGCQVLDLTASDSASASAAVLRARHLPILSVGSGPAFCSDGGQVCLHFKGDDNKFEINLSAVRESGLSISARLLMLSSGRTAGKDGQ